MKVHVEFDIKIKSDTHTLKVRSDIEDALESRFKALYVQIHGKSDDEYNVEFTYPIENQTEILTDVDDFDQELYDELKIIDPTFDYELEDYTYTLDESRNIDPVTGNIIEKILAGGDVRSIISESVCVNEERRFDVGDKFIYTDKYGVTHECTVKKRVECEDPFDPDEKVADITYSYPTRGAAEIITVPVYRSEQRDSFGDEYFVSDAKDRIANWVFPNRK